MNPSNPFAAVNLHGDGTMRGVTVALPRDRVSDFLPAGMKLGEQSVSPPGTHPVILFFHDMFRAQMSIPTLLPNMTYREHSVGVPFTYISPDALARRHPARTTSCRGCTSTTSSPPWAGCSSGASRSTWPGSR